MSNFRQTKKKAWLYYRDWMRQKTTCPLLKAEVKITRKGWNHLLSRRDIKDKHSRLNLLKPAKFIICNADKYSIKKRNNITYHILEGQVNKGKVRGKIKVILRKDIKGNFYFYSVMRT